jgi:hypothetical protein
MEMQNTNVVRLKSVPAKKSNRAMIKKMRRQAMSGVAIGAVAVCLTGLSLSHLAHGIELVTDSGVTEAWAMAIGIDVGFIAMELAQLNAATEKLAKAIARFTKPAIMGTLIFSAAMNAFAFSAQAKGYMIAPAVVLGIAIPGLIYALTRIGAALYIDCDSKK